MSFAKGSLTMECEVSINHKKFPTIKQEFVIHDFPFINPLIILILNIHFSYSGIVPSEQTQLLRRYGNGYISHIHDVRLFLSTLRCHARWLLAWKIPHDFLPKYYLCKWSSPFGSGRCTHLWHPHKVSIIRHFIKLCLQGHVPLSRYLSRTIGNFFISYVTDHNNRVVKTARYRRPESVQRSGDNNCCITLW